MRIDDAETTDTLRRERNVYRELAEQQEAATVRLVSHWRSVADKLSIFESFDRGATAAYRCAANELSEEFSSLKPVKDKPLEGKS